MAKVRLDTLLHQRGLYPSRSAAAAAILAGDVRIGGRGSSGPGALKPGTQVDAGAEVEAAAPPRFVSRGGIKLANALERLAIDVDGRRALDVGASTGGFSDCLLQAGAAAVTAVDVAYGELAWAVRNDPRVTVIERQNARHLTADQLPYAPDLVVADVSFISLTKLLPALAAIVAPRFDALLMVKPQFEVGRDRIGDGVVRDPALRREAIVTVATAARDGGWSVLAAAPSGLPGPKGNRETFLLLAEGARGGVDDLAALALAAEPGEDA
ncbi:TlyA family RNA methyltransferase [Patulibacter defluvii]|uniref:TlyA family RNA methyltransferase n=1 Tax=Patulibacter defluvii TaxID=3095358 RepID=UPI002A756C81|nr:TlyA family RNA methyltransferase [Patulibacter sp. DM4]